VNGKNEKTNLPRLSLGAQLINKERKKRRELRRETAVVINMRVFKYQFATAEEDKGGRRK